MINLHKPSPGWRRRDFLAGSAAVATAAGTAVPAFGATVASDMAPRLVIICHDPHLPTQLGIEMASRVGSHMGYRTDIATLWYSRLVRDPSHFRAPIAGLTTVGGLFCFEELATAQGMRLVAAVGVGDGIFNMVGDPSWLRSVQRLGGMTSRRRDRELAIYIAAGAPAARIHDAPAARFARAPRDSAVAWIMAPQSRSLRA